jgi:hypothetical protein
MRGYLNTRRDEYAGNENEVDVVVGLWCDYSIPSYGDCIREIIGL